LDAPVLVKVPMPSTVAHMASASLIALTLARVEPDEIPYVLAALISAGAMDIDHAVYLIRQRDSFRRTGYRGQLHLARSAGHELLGLMSAGIVAGVLSLVDRKLSLILFLAFAVHIVEDWVLGKSHPLAPVDHTEMQFFSLSFQAKVWLDLAIVAISGVLWALYLAGGV